MKTREHGGGGGYPLRFTIPAIGSADAGDPARIGSLGQRVGPARGLVIERLNAKDGVQPVHIFAVKAATRSELLSIRQLAEFNPEYVRWR